MLFSLRINVSFSTHIEPLPEINILPCFDELSPLLERFKSGMVYTRRRLTLHGTKFMIFLVPFFHSATCIHRFTRGIARVQ
jgi:hypothetical protein